MPQATDYILIGVDGGATEAKAHHVTPAGDDNDAFLLGQAAAARKYERLLGFRPVPVTEQLAQREAGSVQLTANERIQGSMLVQAACEAVAETAKVASGNGPPPVLVGIGMPGLKTADGRGIAVINNGPRIPDYLDQFEQRLGEMGVQFAAPVAELGSDADYCGVGELYAADGLFRGAENAYYIGCGTGIADAMILHGRLVTFDEASNWILKAWQIPSALGATFERLVSAKSMNDCYARLRGDAEGRESYFPEIAAVAGGTLALTWMRTASMVLAELIYERIHTLRHGRPNAPHRGPAYAALEVDHPYQGTLLQRIVLGQRLGRIYGDTRFHVVFGDRLDSHLAALIGQSDDAEMLAKYLDRNRLRLGVLRASTLRAAPALGAAIAAAQALRTG